MKDLLATLFILSSACAVAALCILPESRDLFPFRIIAPGAHIADVLFHEMGHTVFNWLFGAPSIPMIFTLYGADQAAGMAMTFERSWLVQIVAFAAMGFICHRLRKAQSNLFVPAVLFGVTVFCIAFTPYYLVIILYMGHGGAVAMGGWLLYRGCLYLDSRNQFERWLNAFLGFFLIGNNFYFSYTLAFDAEAREDYSTHVAFGIADNDFQAIADRVWRWSVKGIGEFTMGYCCAVIIVSLLLAICRRRDSDEYE